MAKALVDSSVWISYFRGHDPRLGAMIDRLLDEEQAIFCGMVELELLSGVRAHERSGLSDLLGALPYAEATRDDFAWAGEKLGELRTKGITIPSSDALIAAICFRLGLLLLTGDSHFDYLPEIRRLEVTP